MEGEPLTMRCRGWKNKLVYNVVFYQNDKAFKFSPRNSEFTILKTNLSHSGVYHCSVMGRQLYVSPGVPITVQGMCLNRPRAVVLRTIINHRFHLQAPKRSLAH